MENIGNRFFFTRYWKSIINYKRNVNEVLIYYFMLERFASRKKIKFSIKSFKVAITKLTFIYQIFFFFFSMSKDYKRC